MLIFAHCWACLFYNFRVPWPFNSYLWLPSFFQYSKEDTWLFVLITLNAYSSALKSGPTTVKRFSILFQIDLKGILKSHFFSQKIFYFFYLELKHLEIFIHVVSSNNLLSSFQYSKEDTWPRPSPGQTHCIHS